MDVAKLITSQAETEVLREQNELQRERIKELEEQLSEANPGAPLARKVAQWLDEGEGKTIFEEVKAFKEFVSTSRKKCEADCMAKFKEMRLRHIPMLERFQAETGAAFDLGALFGALDGDDDW